MFETCHHGAPADDYCDWCEEEQREAYLRELRDRDSYPWRELVGVGLVVAAAVLVQHVAELLLF